jgi:transcriptional regulator
MRQYPFALLISGQGKPVATHLPFVAEQRGDELYLISHLAKANPQGELLTNNELLVVFSEPHAYISPTHYEKEQNVPTWNYIAVHAYGEAQLITDEAEGMGLLEKMILTYEKSYLAQWKGLSDDYKKKMFKGITAFEIKITDLQATSKLSQNKTDLERKNIINTLEKSGDSVQHEIAKAMK